MTVDIQISAKTSQGKTTTRTISDINPEATNEQLATLGTMINAFTTNVYEGTTKITKINVDNEE